jgi:hypothetical protein
MSYCYFCRKNDKGDVVKVTTRVSVRQVQKKIYKVCRLLRAVLTTEEVFSTPPCHMELTEMYER